MVQISDLLTQASLDPTNIISTIIILRSMQDFVASNKVSFGIPSSNLKMLC